MFVIRLNGSRGLIGQLHLVTLRGQLPLQRPIHQRYGHVDVPDLELSRIEGRVSIFIAQVSGDRDPDVLACDRRKKSSVDYIPVKADLLIFDRGHGAEVAVWRKLPSA